MIKRGPRIVTDGLFFYIDAANSKSYISGSDFTSNILSTSLTGSFINNTTVDYSIKNGVFTFDGNDDAIKLGGTDDANSWLIPSNSTDPFSFSAWFNTNDTSTSQYIIVAAQGGGSTFNLRIVSNIVRFRIRYQSGSPYYKDIDTSTILSNNVWYNVVMVFTGSEMKIYLNGIEDATPISTTFYRLTSAVNGAIGTYWYYLTNAPYAGDFNGELGPMAFYKSKALSSQEVLQNYNALKGRFG